MSGMDDDLFNEATAHAVAVVAAKVRGDDEGCRVLLVDLERHELENLAGALAAILAWLGPDACGSAETFLDVLAAIREQTRS